MNPIKGYEGLYYITRDGRIYNSHNLEMKLSKNANGYNIITLSKNNVSHTYIVHRLVAETFLPNPDGLPCVNHKDENKANNYVNNLEWCSVSYNNNYGTRQERVSKAQQNNFRSKKIGQYSLDGQLVKIWPSTGEVQRQLNYDKSNIQKVARGVKHTAYGFIWKYEEE